LFVVKIKRNTASLIINLNGDVTDNDRVSEIKFGKEINFDTKMNTLFTLSVSDAEMSKLEGFIMTVDTSFKLTFELA